MLTLFKSTPKGRSVFNPDLSAGDPRGVTVYYCSTTSSNSVPVDGQHKYDILLLILAPLLQAPCHLHSLCTQYMPLTDTSSSLHKCDPTNCSLVPPMPSMPTCPQPDYNHQYLYDCFLDSKLSLQRYSSATWSMIMLFLHYTEWPISAQLCTRFYIMSECTWHRQHTAYSMLMVNAFEEVYWGTQRERGDTGAIHIARFLVNTRGRSLTQARVRNIA